MVHFLTEQARLKATVYMNQSTAACSPDMNPPNYSVWSILLEVTGNDFTNSAELTMIMNNTTNKYHKIKSKLQFLNKNGM
jgi:hypothetical protein